MRSLAPLIAALALLTVSCDKSTTSPDTTTPTQTPAAASISESFVGIVPVSGSSFFSFTVTEYGTVNVTLNAVSGSMVPATVTLGLGLGTPDATDCTTSTSVNTAAGATVQLTATYAAGVYCARVSDVGNLFAPASFDVTIAHP